MVFKKYLWVFKGGWGGGWRSEKTGTRLLLILSQG
jgi:hypothetical protein